MTVQSIAAIVRQVLAIAAIVMGALTQALPSLHLSAGVSGALVAIGGAILTVEHYVADPSTGTPAPVLQMPPVAAPVAPPA